MSETVRAKSFRFATSTEWLNWKRARAMVPEAHPIDVSTPAELGGEGGRWSPEELLLAAVESCTLLTFVAEAGRAGIDVVSWNSTAEGRVAKGSDGRFAFVEVLVRPVVTVRTEADADRARALFETVGKKCFIGSSLKAEPRIEGRVEVSTPDRQPAASSVAAAGPRL